MKPKNLQRLLGKVSVEYVNGVHWVFCGELHVNVRSDIQKKLNMILSALTTDNIGNKIRDRSLYIKGE